MSAYPIIHALFAPDSDGKQRVVNTVVTLTSAGPSLCLRPSGKDWICDNGEHSAVDLDQARAAIRSALGAR